MIDYYHQKTHFLNHRTWLLFVISKGDMTCHAIEKQNFIWVKFGAAAFLYRLSICYCKYYILLKNHHDLVKNNLPLFFFHAEALDDRQRYINFSLRFFALWGSKLLFCFCLLLEIHFSQTDDSSFVARRPPSGLKMRPLVPVSGF